MCLHVKVWDMLTWQIVENGILNQCDLPCMIPGTLKNWRHWCHQKQDWGVNRIEVPTWRGVWNGCLRSSWSRPPTWSGQASTPPHLSKTPKVYSLKRVESFWTRGQQGPLRASGCWDCSPFPQPPGRWQLGLPPPIGAWTAFPRECA